MGDWKDTLANMGYSVNKENNNQDEINLEKPKSIDKSKQHLVLETDSKGRKGKVATIITGFDGTQEQLEELAKIIKIKCGVGGSARGGEILIQGNVKNKVFEILKKEGYVKTKLI